MLKEKRKLDLPEGVPPLTTYYMYITSGCNLACRHCWIAPSFEPDGGCGECLDFEFFKTAVNEAIPLGLNRIKFTGGEPLLHPDFRRMVDYATEKELKTNLETNGTLLSRELSRYLKEKTSMYSVAVSIDGVTAETHDYMRNVTGSFEKARKGVHYLVESGYKPQVIMSLYPDNVEEIEPMINWAVETGCGSVKFNIIQPSGRGEQMKKNNSLLSIEELLELGNWVEKELRSRYSIPLFYSWPMVFHGIRRLNNDLGGNCNLYYILGILSSGELAMCGIGTQEKDLVYGFLEKDKVIDVWSSAAGLKKLRKVIPSQLEGICSKCIFKSRCLGTCVAQNYHATGRLTAPFWFCQQADEIGLFPASRKK